MQQTKPRLSGIASRIAVVASTGFLMASLAHAEGPMNVDDAGTLDKGGMKVEAVLGKHEGGSRPRQG